MDLQRLFTLIRTEGVVFFIGSGFSLYAGFPSSKEIVNTLFNSLSEPEKKQIKKNSQLHEFSEDFVHLKNQNRQQLIEILKNIFEDTPKSTKVHDIVTKIPYIRDIITTNYDTLIENAYGPRALKICCDQDVPFISNSKINIIKAHGDLSCVENLIITKSDYLNFFNDNNTSRLWMVIKERFATKHIVFIGYSLEDWNIEWLFNLINNSNPLRQTKEAFFVAPKIKKLKQKKLSAKSIGYINCTGEEFFKSLEKNILDNVIQDLHDGRTSADNFNRFITQYNITADLRMRNNNFQLMSLHSIDGITKGNLNFTVKNKGNFKSFNDLASGKKFGKLEIPANDLLNIEIRYGGIKLPVGKGTNSLIFYSQPSQTSSFDISFTDGFELYGIPVKIFKSDYAVEFHVEYKTSKYIVKVEPGNLLNVKFIHEKFATSVNDEIQIYELLNHLYSGKEFTIYSNHSKKVTHSFPYQEERLIVINRMLTFFKNLKKIERHYKIRFGKIEAISDEAFENAEIICKIINQERLLFPCNSTMYLGIEKYSTKLIEGLKKIQGIKRGFLILNQEPKIIKLYEHDLNVGFERREFLFPKILNLDSIIKKQAEEVEFISESNEMEVFFESSNMTPQRNILNEKSLK